MSIAENVQKAQEKVREAALAAGRAPEEVRILLASKTVEPDGIGQALTAGADLFGENRIQEALGKQDQLQQIIAGLDHPVEQHFIGHLQSNKIKDMLGFASMLHSLDRPSLAKKLNTALERIAGQNDASSSELSPPLPFPVLIQVNTSEEESKFGVEPESAQSLVNLVLSLPMLELRGFMTIGLFSDDTGAVRRGFRRLREIRDAAQQHTGRALPELSMGMSGDFALAVAEGATIVRLGSSVFGSRA